MYWTCFIFYPFCSYHLLDKVTLKKLENLVKTDKPIKLGRQLDVDENNLALAEIDHQNDHDKQLSKVLSLYMRQTVEPTWQQVAKALWKIGERNKAQRIADKYGMTFLNMQQHAQI